MENEVQISRNRHDIDIAGRRGMSRKGACLLQGLVICGRCGSRMTVNYHGEAKASPSYVRPVWASANWCKSNLGLERR